MALFGTGASDGETSGEPTSEDDIDDSEEAAALARSILNGLEEPTLVVDTDGEITHINSQACELFDTTEDDAVGTEPSTLRRSDSGLVTEALDRGEDIQGREETITVGAESVPVERTVTLLYDEDGECTGAMEIDKDVTEQQRQRRRKAKLEDYQQRVLDDLQDKLARLADGDLTVDPTVPEPEADFEEMRTVYEEFTEMNENLGRAVDNLRGIVEHVTEDADTVAGASDSLSATVEEVTASIEEIDAATGELTDGSEDLATRSERASGNVDELSASIEEITASLQEIDRRASEASDLASGGVDDATQAVGQIRSATDSTSDVAAQIDDLEASMAEVGEITEMIQNIAEQTNMLALNANIEAARAGEAGEGFAVVANEIKQLAEESQSSAENIAAIIEDLQDQTGTLVEGIKDANDEVADGADAVEDVVEAIEEIETRVEETSEGVGEIADAVDSQADNAEEVSAVIEETTALAEEITASIQQIAAGIDEQADATEEAAYQAEQLSQLSDGLLEMIDLFRLDAEESAAIDDADTVDARTTDAEDVAETAKQQVTGAVGGDSVLETGDRGGSATGGDGPTELSPEDF